jgi:immune inhibitor A
MKKGIILSAIFAIFSITHIFAVPALPISAQFVQPDGSAITLRLMGDEFQSFLVTSDGYTVLKRADGAYVYAELADSSLVATGVLASDAPYRSAAVEAYLQSVPKYLHPALVKPLRFPVRVKNVPGAAVPKAINYSKFRGLVILAAYNDCSFSRADANAVFDSIVNCHNFKGFKDAVSDTLIPYTGSVRDYFFDNSCGVFDPHFDVVGPVKIGYSQLYPQGTSYGRTVVEAAVDAADALVNYADYDTNGDGYADMVYVIFAGPGSNVVGNNSNYIWPHASSLAGTKHDGVYIGRYACSTEYFGKQAWKMIDGVGTICHEFSHVLGLPDLYDTDYSGSGGQSVHPGKWTLMASGCYLNNCRTPAGYGLYERYALGFTAPQLITGNSGSYSLSAINRSNSGLRLNTLNDGEFFLLENRQKTGWDAYLPGEGMLIFRVDSTAVDSWRSNSINANPAHNYYELVRADRQYNSSGAVIESAGDPFPGSGNVESVGNSGTPSLLTGGGQKSPVGLSGITLTDSVVTFNIVDISDKSRIEDFESMPVTTSFTDVSGVEGVFSNWDFLDSAHVAAVSDGIGHGRHVLALFGNSVAVTTTPIKENVDDVSFMMWNPTNQTVMVRLLYSVDSCATWNIANNFNSSNYYELGEGDSITAKFKISTVKPVNFKFWLSTGSSVTECVIDDFTVHYVPDSTSSAVQPVRLPQSDFSAFRVGNVLSVSTSVNVLPVSLYSVDGTLVARAAPVDGELQFMLHSRGIYIVCQGGISRKIIF